MKYISGNKIFNKYKKLVMLLILFAFIIIPVRVNAEDVKEAYLVPGESFSPHIGSEVTGAFRRATLEEYNVATLTDSNKVSTSSSPYDVYVWIAGNDALYYTEAEKMYMNANSYKMFGRLSITSIDLSEFDTSLVTNMGSMFIGYKGTSLNVSNFDTNNVTDMSNMFEGCVNLTTLDVSSFDTSNVTKFNYMFKDCKLLEEIDLSGFDTSASPSTNNMFDGATSLRSVYVSNKWDNTKIGNSTNMFEHTQNLIGYYGFEFVQGGNSTYHDKTYARADTEDPNNRGFFTDVSHKGEMNTVTYPDGTVEVYPHNSKIDIPTNDGSKPNEKVAEITFKYHDDVTDDTTMDVEKVYYQNGWYVNNEHYWNGTRIVVGENLLLEYCFGENIARVESFPRPEREGYSFVGWWTDEYGGERIYNYAETEDITLHAHWSDPFAEFAPGYEFSSKMNNLIYGPEYDYDHPAKYFRKATLEEYNLAKDMIESDVDENGNNKHIVSSENTGDLIYAWKSGDDLLYYSKTDNIYLNEYSSSMFSNLPFEEIDLSGINAINSNSLNGFFNGCGNLVSINFGDKFDTSNVTDMSYMFASSSIKHIDLSVLDTSNVTNMSYMFNYAESLETINFGIIDTSKVTEMRGMFQNCSSLTEIDLSKQNLNNVQYAGYMFQECTSLSSLKLSNKRFSNIINAENMFSNCSSLEELDLTRFDTSNLEQISYMFSYMTNLKTVYVSDLWDNSNIQEYYDNGTFDSDTQLVGEKGTTYDANYIGREYARVDNAPDSPGYFTYAKLYTVTYPDGSEELYREGEGAVLNENNYHNDCDGVVHVSFDYNYNENGGPVDNYDVCINTNGNGWIIDNEHYDNNSVIIVTKDITLEYDNVSSLDPVTMPKNVTHEDWAFLGWYDMNNELYEAETYNEIADTTFTAKWDRGYPEDITIDSDDITLIVGETHQIEVTFIPDGTEDTLTYTGYDDTKISVVNGLITGLSEGTTTITVGTENTDIEKTINVTIINGKFASSTYSVVDKEKEDQTTDRIIIGAEPETLISDFKSNLDNPSEYIKIYDGDNELSDDDIVKTGLTIRLEVNGTIYDEAIIIIRGDINEDGLVNVIDKSIISEHVLRLNNIEGYKTYAADVDNNDSINITDKSKLSEYILRLIDSLNE